MRDLAFFLASSVATCLVAFVGCSSSPSGTGGSTSTGHHTTTSSGSPHTTSSTSSGSTSGSTSTSGSSSSGAGGSTTSSSSGGTGGGASNPFECTVPMTPPSGGSCVTTVMANDAGTGIECNPVTNEGCQMGAECDTNGDSMGNIIGFVCYPPPNNATLCGMCDNQNGPFCGGGLTCQALDNTGTNNVCAKYCCTDADCGTGKCATMDSSNMPLFGTIAPNLGVCVAM